MVGCDCGRVVTSVEVVEVVEVMAKVGRGVAGDPYRMVVQYWSHEGELLAERDDWREAHQRSLAEIGLGVCSIAEEAPEHERAKPEAATTRSTIAGEPGNPACGGCGGQHGYHRPTCPVAAQRLVMIHTQEPLRRAVNSACTCGGRGPDDEPCPACAVWHTLAAVGRELGATKVGS